ncbi:MAG TPA: prepilin-type N-terminal cleavage/methylation domain-containing protein [Candidatus Eisenbacteria bacterium]|nr:prepilin-type N-terminal cleavage/methylation domain-containing protein [Candidatus Eisenbacteria bacterium]
MNAPPSDQRGLTLTEVTIVAAIGVIVLLGMAAFYLESQGTWLDASNQAITQREASFITQTIADSVRSCAKAVVSPSATDPHATLTLYKHSDLVNPAYCFWWGSDGHVHAGPDPTSGDLGPMTESQADTFRALTDPTHVQVWLTLRAATGQRVSMTTSAVLMNR